MSDFFDDLLKRGYSYIEALEKVEAVPAYYEIFLAEESHLTNTEIGIIVGLYRQLKAGDEEKIQLALDDFKAKDSLAFRSLVEKCIRSRLLKDDIVLKFLSVVSNFKDLAYIAQFMGQVLPFKCSSNLHVAMIKKLGSMKSNVALPVLKTFLYQDYRTWEYLGNPLTLEPTIVALGDIGTKESYSLLFSGLMDCSFDFPTVDRALIVLREGRKPWMIKPFDLLLDCLCQNKNYNATEINYFFKFIAEVFRLLGVGTLSS